MSDYSPQKLRKLWDEFRAYAEQGRREGLSIYLDNTKTLERDYSYKSGSIIHTTGTELELLISRTINY